MCQLKEKKNIFFGIMSVISENNVSSKICYKSAIYQVDKQWYNGSDNVSKKELKIL